MTRLRVHNFAISLDGYGAGRDQGPEDPLECAELVASSSVVHVRMVPSVA
jgi:hypothetical protein